MNKLKKNLPFLLATIIGFLAIGSFYFFYFKQKEFSINQKEFLLALNAIETNEAKLEYTLLQNYIYAYNNNDEITQALTTLEESFNKLIASKILLNENYMVLQEDIGLLKNEIDTIFINTQRFLMLNAAIKNSLIFLATYDNKFPRKNSNQFSIQAGKIVVSLLYAKRMNDLSFIDKKLQLPLTLAQTEEERTFIQNFNNHTKFLAKTFPLFIQYNTKIESNKIYMYAQSLKERFSKIAIKDIDILNNFSIILFVIFTTTYLYLIIILLKYAKEHEELEKTTRSLQYTLIHDVLTGFKNRRAFENDKKTLQHPSIILFNIDRFKDINDTYGNSVGDETLKRVANIIKESILYKDGVVDIYRTGGDEFCILFENYPLKELEQLAEYIQNKIASYEFTINGNEISVTTTLAINEVQPLLENADLALKSLKRNKNKKLIVYKQTLGLQEVAHKNVKMLQILKRAIKEDRIVPYFQPIINLKTNKIEKYEALVRIIEDDKVITPYHFLELSKKTTLYQEITQIVIEKTIQIAELYPEFRFSINLSMTDILNEPLIETLFELFEKNLTVANRIDIELLETEHLEDLEKVKNFIDRLHSFGSLVLLDDFGSGFSNFSYFAELEIDIVKIDGSIINEIETNRRKLHMLESITMFSKGMNLRMIAEFVDSKEIITTLKRLGIDYAQGYYYSQPIPHPIASLEDI